MSTARIERSSLSQLAEFRSAFFQSVLVVGLSYIVFVIFFFPLGGLLGIRQMLGSLIGLSNLPAYLIASGAGLCLYMTAANFSDQADSEENGHEEALSVQEAFERVAGGESVLEILKTGFGQTLAGLAAFTFLSILVFIGGTLGLVVATHLSGALGAALAILYPIADIEINEQIRWYLSPATSLLVISYIALIPYAMMITVLAGTFGFFIGVSLGIPIVIIQFLYETVKSAGISETVQRPVMDIRRRGHF